MTTKLKHFINLSTTNLPALGLCLCALSATQTLASDLMPMVSLQAKGQVDFNTQEPNEIGLANWWQGGAGQLAQPSGGIHGGPILAALTLDSSIDLSAHLHLSQQSTLAAASGITEAWLQYQPLSASGYRLRARAGFFYPALSVENSDVAWSSPYTSQFSVLNSWYAEELRAKTIELQLNRPGRFFDSPHSWQLVIAAFQGNDPLGTLIAWRGFAMHNYQTAWQERIHFANYPSLRRAPLQLQPAWVEPFAELDHRTGYYAGGHYQYKQNIDLRYYHYDNNADPTVFADGQYAWENVFNQWAVQWQINDDWRLLSQLSGGQSEMGWDTVVINYQSGFVLLNYQHERWQISSRFDRWIVHDFDSTAQDPNNGSGHGYTLAVQYQLNDQWSLLWEWNQLNSHQQSRAQWGQWPVDATEQRLQWSVIWRLE